jgi:hypothetical protein
MLVQYNTFNRKMAMADVENTAPMGGFAVDAKPAPVATTVAKQAPPGFKASVIIWSWIQCTASLPLQCALH